MTSQIVATFAGQPVLGVNQMPSDYGKWFIHGLQGTGKSTLASTLGQIGRTLFIDLTGEQGIRSFRESPWSSNVEVLRPESVTVLSDIFWALAAGNHPYACAVLDSLTSVQKLTMRYLMGHDEDAVREIQRASGKEDRPWQASLDVMTGIPWSWYGLANGKRAKPMHIAITAQTKAKEDEFGRYNPDIQPGALSMALAAPDYVLYTEIEDNPAAIEDEEADPVRYVVRFGAHPEYRCKARVPYRMRGKIPPIVGRKGEPSLLTLSRILGIGGLPPKPKALKAVATPTAITKEN